MNVYEGMCPFENSLSVYKNIQKEAFLLKNVPQGFSWNSTLI